MALSKLAGHIYCLLVSPMAVERKFSGACIIIHERRTVLDLDQVKSILVIHSMNSFLD